MLYDVKSLYPSVDVPFVISKIIEKIYFSEESAQYFFETNLDDENKIKVIPKNIFEEFLKSILCGFTTFETQIGIFRQTSGMSMGSSISGTIANIYLSFIEEIVIDEKVRNGDIRMYLRYVDDIILCADQITLDLTFQELNNFHDNLKFTKDPMVDQKLPYLDTLVYFDKKSGQFELRSYQKPSKSNTVMNYVHSNAPKHYKDGCLIGEIYRANSTTSTPENLYDSLSNLKSKFLRNGYPIRLIEHHIDEVVGRKFEPKERTKDYDKMKKEHPEMFHTFCYTFLDSHCDFIAKQTQKYLKSKTENFHVNFAWKTYTLHNLITPRLKAQIELLNCSGLVYKFECPCSESYVGETYRTLSTRITEHNAPSRNSEIVSHIRECTKFNDEVRVQCPNLSRTSKLFHLKTKFRILEKNLTDYRNRVLSESMHIILEKPTLNKQESFLKLNTIT